MRFSIVAAVLSLLRVVESRPLTSILLLHADISAVGPSTMDRSQYDIVRSCILTIIACVWTSGHPNIAAPKDSGWKTFKRRVVTMVYALIAPEAVVMWALRQYIAAERIANEYNSTATPDGGSFSTHQEGVWTYLRGCCHEFKRNTTEWFIGPSDTQVLRRKGRPWTKTHGLFVQMGGFMLYSDGRPIRVLSFKELKGMLRDGKIDEPLVTERELKDRTKNDTLSKALVVVQTTWFIFQCGARWNADLPLTELEVVTLGFAVLNAVIYTVWWNKPQSVEVAIAVSLKNDQEQTAAEPGGFFSDHSTDNLQGTKPDSKSRQDDRESKPGNILYQGASALLRPLKDMLSCRTIPQDACRVPDFYADDKGPKESGRACAIACIVGTVFGALHALAWTSIFPSYPELALWRFSTLIITAEPVFMLLVGILYEEKMLTTSPPPSMLSTSLDTLSQQDQPRASTSIKNILRQTFIVLFALGAPLYILARFTLIILAFTSLRALPPGAFKVVSWTSFIPHL